VITSVEKKELKVPAHIDYLGDMRDFVTQIGKKHGFSDKLINAFKLAVDEAATNIIRHAYRDKEGLITIRAFVKKNSLTLSIIDQGTYFDPKRVKDPDLNRYIDIGKKGGLGIFIMRKLMDDIEYRKTEEGNELRITKKRDHQDKKKNLIKSVSTIPFLVKAKYFFRTLAVVGLIIASGYFYFFMEADKRIRQEFITFSKLINRQILTRISSAPAEEFEFIEGVVEPIYQGYREQLFQIAVVVDSTGSIEYSSNPADLFTQFYRPSEVERLGSGIFKYELRGQRVYEFEEPIVIGETGTRYGTLHVYYATDSVDEQISSLRRAYLKLALLIFGISNVGIALLIYLVMNPFRKLSEWVKNLGTGEIEDEIEIDSGTELGEIAQAFSGITQKLRESQRNLADQERLQKEMQVAQEIQQTLLPMEFPELDGYELSSYYEAAKEVGGDYYDFVEVDHDTLGIAVADVSGKGVPGSLVMTMIRTALRTEARGLKDAAEVLARVNSFVSNDIKKGMFVTVFYLIIDSKKRSVNYASAGHNPMILYRASTEKTYYLNPKGFPIGVQLPEKDLFRSYIQSDTIKLAKGDILLVYTDGITEAMNPSRELYGEERLLNVLRTHGHLSADEFVEKLKDDIYSFTEGAAQYDDITLVAIKEESTREEDELRRAKEAHTLVSQGKSIKEACEQVNLTTYAYYTKYKKVFEEEGIDSFEIDQTSSVEAKHISIEDKTKLFAVIAANPEFGAARIKDELDTEKYGYCKLSETQIYEELVRNRLNTRQLREAFVARTSKSRERLKPPGTPLMTLDGELIINKAEWRAAQPTEEPPAPSVTPDTAADVEVDASDDSDRAAPAKYLDEADALLDAPLEELLTSDATGQVDAPARADTVDSPEESGTFEDLVADSFEEADDEESGAFVQQHATGDDNAPTEETTDDSDDVDFEQLVSGSYVEFDDSLISEEEDESAAAESREESKDEAGLSTATDDTAVAAQDLQLDEDQSLTPSIDELLQESYASDFAADDLFEDEDNGETTAQSTELRDDETKEILNGGSPPTRLPEPPVEEHERHPEDAEHVAGDVAFEHGGSDETEEEEGVSFSDLIQAIDDEIVYVKEYEEIRGGHQHAEKVMPQNSGQEQSSHKVANRPRADLELQTPQETREPEEKAESKELILINGIRYYKNNEYDKAIREFKKVITLHPDYKEAHSILGNAYFRNKMYEDAAIAYKRVKEIDPEDITAYENMGVIYANQGDYKHAVEEWQMVLRLNPDRKDIEEKINKALRLMV